MAAGASSWSGSRRNCFGTGDPGDASSLLFSICPVACSGKVPPSPLFEVSESCDRWIAFRPPSHVVRHPNKVLWFIHHIRIYYDLWDSRFRPVPDTAKGRSLRQALFDLDTRTISEAK